MDVSIKDLLQATIEEGGSDLHVRALVPPQLRVHGDLCPLADDNLTEEDTLRLCREIASPAQMDEVEKNGGEWVENL